MIPALLGSKLPFSMHITITCGPSYEPIDYVRRLTNFSTGELGVLLAASMTEAGHRVSCFKGESATYCQAGVEVQNFTTNEDLVSKLAGHARTSPCDVFFHIAALNDFRVKKVHDENGTELEKGKISSSTKGLTIQLEPAVKIISLLPKLFTNAKIVGWKYGVDGTRDDLLALGRKQMALTGTTACVVNGPAWGKGFGLLQGENVEEVASKKELCSLLVNRVSSLR